MTFWVITSFQSLTISKKIGDCLYTSHMMFYLKNKTLKNLHCWINVDYFYNHFKYRLLIHPVRQWYLLSWFPTESDKSNVNNLISFFGIFLISYGTRYCRDIAIIIFFSIIHTFHCHRKIRLKALSSLFEQLQYSGILKRFSFEIASNFIHSCVIFWVIISWRTLWKISKFTACQSYRQNCKKCQVVSISQHSGGQYRKSTFWYEIFHNYFDKIRKPIRCRLFMTSFLKCPLKIARERRSVASFNLAKFSGRFIFSFFNMVVRTL